MIAPELLNDDAKRRRVSGASSGDADGPAIGASESDQQRHQVRWRDAAGCASARSDAGGARITVEDRGLGIDAEDRKHLFEPFYRGREAVSRQIQGSGLGLHLVRRIVEAHGGTVSVQSEAGKGSAFTIALPVLHSVLILRDRLNVVRAEDDVKARLLLVEDEPGLQLVLSDRLVSEGYQVETAADGDTGLARASGEPFDLIILDVMLPKRDGFDVARTLRHQGILTPILMLTARGQVVDRVVGLKLGADDYLTKPFEMIELLARLEALLRRAPASAGVSLERYQFGEVLVDVRKAEVKRHGSAIDLSAKEFQLLRYLHRASWCDGLARRAAARSVGLPGDAVDANGRRACGLAQAEARTQSTHPAVHPDGARDGLQVRWLASAHTYGPRSTANFADCRRNPRNPRRP